MVHEADLNNILFMSSLIDFLSNFNSPLEEHVKYYSLLISLAFLA
jgi:hypothetical protein